MPIKSEILWVCIQLYLYHDISITGTELSVGELYHEICGNNCGVDFESFKNDI